MIIRVDERRGIAVYEFPNGDWIDLDLRAVREQGPGELLRGLGYGRRLPTERVAVIQHGRRVGTVPPDFEPLCVRSKTFLYSVRPGDFRRIKDAWVASNTLGQGDLEAVPGFVWDHDGKSFTDYKKPSV